MTGLTRPDPRFSGGWESDLRRMVLSAVAGAVGVALGVVVWMVASALYVFACQGNDSRADPAASSSQAQWCDRVPPFSGAVFFAVVAALTLALVIIAALRHWSGRWPLRALLAVVTLPALLQGALYLLLAAPADDCSADQHVAVQEWRDDGRRGVPPYDCSRPL